uniref:Gamma-secretase subunit PEN-2 n=1 Tax=Setaria digitata TaxID=48799 RepID=A0A915Q6N2_9BILA
MSKWEKRALKVAAVIGIGAYPAAMIAFHNRLINFGRSSIDYKVPDEIVDMVENELDKLKNLLMKVDTHVAVTDSLNPEWRGGFYFRNGFELLLPLRVIAKDASELPRMKKIVSITSNDLFSNKKKLLDTTTDAGKHVFDDYFLSDAARRFVIRRELLRANSRRFVLIPVSTWILLSSIVSLSFTSLMRYGRIISYSSLAFLIPLAILCFRNTVRNFNSYSEMMLDHDACADSPEYVEGARQYFKSSAATNLRIRSALGDSDSELIARNGDRVDLLWKINNRWARRIRVGLVASTIVSVPSIYLLGNGPYLKEYFEKRYDVSTAIPAHLQQIIDSVSVLEIQITSVNLKYMDSVTHGALNSMWGARTALPFYTQFQTFDEAYDYCKKKLEPMLFMGEQACVIWESAVGRQIIETFVLSEDALRFLIRRDLTAYETVKRTALFAFYWCCYTSLAFMLAQILVHYYFTGSVLWFCGLSLAVNAPAWWGSVQNARLDWHATDQSADTDAARVSLKHSRGGKEYYQKLLKRNRLLREIIRDGMKKVSAVGNPNDSNTSYWSRYTTVVDLDAENRLMDKIKFIGMDLRKLSDTDKLALCKRYFYIGFAFLPLVWIVNAVWFFESAFLNGPSLVQKTIRQYVLYSIIGASVWVLLLTAWEIFFQLERAKGLEWTDRLSFVFPVGYV